MNNLKAALKYISMGFSVIPVGVDKKPLIKWEEFQKRIATEAEVSDWFRKFPTANLGVVTGIISGLCVIDLDDADAEEEFYKLIPDDLRIPTVLTPRGGKHCYFRCTDAQLSNKAGIKNMKWDFRANGGYVVAPPSANGNGRKYSFVKELHLLTTPIPLLPTNILHILNTTVFGINRGGYRGGELGITKEAVTLSVTLFAEGRRDNDLFHVANYLTKSGMPENETLQVLKLIAKSWGEENEEKWLSEKVKSALKRKEIKEFCLSDELHKFISVTDGDFSVTEALQALQPVTDVTNRDKVRQNIRQILHRMRKDGFIVKVGHKDGIYRRIDATCEEMDWMESDVERLSVSFPFEIENLVYLHPKNIVIVAGSSNSGKTAFLLNVAEMNMDRMKINYFSSEMGSMELKDRLSKFDRPIEDFKKIRFMERVSNFSEVIRPDEINIIDFLEITDEFYKIGSLIKEVFDKLNKGIAIIALQKNTSSPYGLGAERSVEKARLYISMDHGRLRLMKAKNWVIPEVNPNGMTIDFKLVQGCKFVENSPWMQKEEVDEYDRAKKERKF